jgi:hypothetical protein
MRQDFFVIKNLLDPCRRRHGSNDRVSTATLISGDTESLLVDVLSTKYWHSSIRLPALHASACTR